MLTRMLKFTDDTQSPLKTTDGKLQNSKIVPVNVKYMDTGSASVYMPQYDD